MKKILAIMLVVLMILGSFTGCSGKKLITIHAVGDLLDGKPTVKILKRYDDIVPGLDYYSKHILQTSNIIVDYDEGDTVRELLMSSIYVMDSAHTDSYSEGEGYPYLYLIEYLTRYGYKMKYSFKRNPSEEDYSTDFSKAVKGSDIWVYFYR